MACSLKCGSYFSGFNETTLSSNSNRFPWLCSLVCNDSTSKNFPPLRIKFLGNPLVVLDQRVSRNWSSKPGKTFSVQAETTCVSRGMRWWEKNRRANMVKIHSAEELVYSLQNAGNRLVIIGFYSPGCGGCKALHPKIYQLAEQNPNAIFLEVNHEELNNMCNCLNIHVLPFFKFYRGAEGRLCSFSCTISTIKKFKDALAKHGADRCSLGPAKGLDESELMKLAAAGELSTKLQSPFVKKETMEDYLSGVLSKATYSNNMKLEKEPALL